jgi:hypothetical protein
VSGGSWRYVGLGRVALGRVALGRVALGRVALGRVQLLARVDRTIIDLQSRSVQSTFQSRCRAIGTPWPATVIDVVGTCLATGPGSYIP